MADHTFDIGFDTREHITIQCSCGWEKILDLGWMSLTELNDIAQRHLAAVRYLSSLYSAKEVPSDG